MSWKLRLQERVWGLAPWDARRITDEWFRAHFEYAADVVNHWVGGVLDLPTARLLNFGCGDGITDLALMLRHGATAIHGVDIRREYAKLPRIAREQLGMSRIPAGMTFETIPPGIPRGQTPHALLQTQLPAHCGTPFLFIGMILRPLSVGRIQYLQTSGAPGKNAGPGPTDAKPPGCFSTNHPGVRTRCRSRFGGFEKPLVAPHAGYGAPFAG